ncbi:uncharacterized protein LOC106471084 [Limulus polyphemus]|uniref:Uncharacterized protein LOC106471084 n=1 Tax=Limulus polyphemus TaxID=6850 RepID=A0ABM1BR99_LIMPO|nr:uncharacterized protein LOC106471084 [Limulus polyphemus]
MKWHVVQLLALAALTCSFASDVPVNQTTGSCDSVILPEKKLVCYYEAGTDFRLSQLDPCICTHLLYGTPNVTNGLILNTEELDSEDLKSFSDLKNINPNLYILLSLRVFPDNINSNVSSSVSEINNALKEFIKNVRKLVQKNNLDGIDLNIDYLNRKEYGDLTERKETVSLLMKQLRSALDEINSSNPVVLTITVAKRPYLLVNGFDFPLISKSVDFINLPAFHFDEPSQSNLKHPGRLHGVGDMENVDSLVDLLLSFSVPKDKIVVGIPTFGVAYKTSDYRLSVEDSLRKGIEGKVFKGKRKILSHGEVCDFKNSGNWSVLRETDQTSPYTYNEEDWVGYDDEISVRLKTKYVLLRKLGGVIMWPVNNDDYEGVCGNGDFPLIRSVRKVFTDTVKTKDPKTIDEFEAYLEGAESRIVNVVDRYGFVGRVESNSDTFERMICTRQGYYRHPDDCTKFYRCVKFDQYIDDYTIFQYDCPNGLVFDERYEVCNWPSWSLPCDGSGEVLPVPRKTFVCSNIGYFQDPENCRWFYYCSEGNGTLQAFEFKCPFDLAFDEEKLLCNWRWLVPGCGGPYGGITPNVESTAKVISVDRHITPQLNPSGNLRTKKRSGYEHFGEFSETTPRGPNTNFAKFPKSSAKGTPGLVDLGANVGYNNGRGSNSPSRSVEYDEGLELGGQARSVGYETGPGPLGPDENLGYVSGRDSESPSRSIGSGIRVIPESPNRFLGDDIGSNIEVPPNSVIRAQLSVGHGNGDLPSITKSQKFIGGRDHGEQTIPLGNLRYDGRHTSRPPSDSVRGTAHDNKHSSIGTSDPSGFNRYDKRQGHGSPVSAVRYSDRGDRESQVGFEDSVGYRTGHDIVSSSRLVGGGAAYDEEQRPGRPGVVAKHDGRNAPGTSRGLNYGVRYNSQHDLKYPSVPAIGAEYVDGQGPEGTSGPGGVLSYGIKPDSLDSSSPVYNNKYSSTHGPGGVSDPSNIVRYGNRDSSEGPLSDIGYGNEGLVGPTGSAEHSRGHGHVGFPDPDGIVIRDDRNGHDDPRGLVHTIGNIEYSSRPVSGGSVGSADVNKYDPKNLPGPSSGLVFGAKSTPGSLLDPESKVEDGRRLSLLGPVSDVKYDGPYGSRGPLVFDNRENFDIKQRPAGSKKTPDLVGDIEFHNKYGPTSKIDSLHVDRISKRPDSSRQLDNTKIIGYDGRRGHRGSSSPQSGIRYNKEHRFDGILGPTSDVAGDFKNLPGLSEFNGYDTKNGSEDKPGISRDFAYRRRHDSKDTHGPIDSTEFSGVRGSVGQSDYPEVNKNGNRRVSHGIARKSEKGSNGTLISLSRVVDYDGKHEPESPLDLVRGVIYDGKHSPKGSFGFFENSSYGDGPTHGFVKEVGRGDEILTSGLAGDVIHGDKQYFNGRRPVEPKSIGHFKQIIPNKVHTSRAQTDLNHDIPQRYTVKEPSEPKHFTDLSSPSDKPKLYEVRPVSPRPRNTASPKQVSYSFQDGIKEKHPFNQPTPKPPLFISDDASPPSRPYPSSRELFNKKPLYSPLPPPISITYFPTKHPKTSLTNDKPTLVTVTPHFSRTPNHYKHNLGCACKSGTNIGPDCCHNTDYFTPALGPPIRGGPKTGVPVEKPRGPATSRKIQGYFSVHPTIKQTNVSFPPTSPNPQEQLVIYKQSIPIEQDKLIPPRNVQGYFSVQTLPKQPKISSPPTLPLVEEHFVEQPLIYEVKGPLKKTTKPVPPNNIENQSRVISTSPPIAKPHDNKQPLFYELEVQGENTRKTAPPTKFENHFSIGSRSKPSNTPVNYFTEENIFQSPFHTNQPTQEKDNVQTHSSSDRYVDGPFVGPKTRSTPTVVNNVALLQKNIVSTVSPPLFPPSKITFGTYTRKYEPQEEADVYGPPPETTNIPNAPVFGQRLKPVGPIYSFLPVSVVPPPTAVNRIVINNRYTQLPKYNQTPRKLQKPQLVNNEQNGAKTNTNAPTYTILSTVPSRPLTLPASKDVVSYTTIPAQDSLDRINLHTPKTRPVSRFVKNNDSQLGRRTSNVQPLIVIDVESLAEASPTASTPVLRNEERHKTQPNYDNTPVDYSDHAVFENAYGDKTTGQGISLSKEPDGDYGEKVTEGVTDYREKTYQQNIPYHSTHLGPVEPSRPPASVVKYQNKNQVSEEVRSPRISQDIDFRKPGISEENVEQGIVNEFRKTTIRDDEKDKETIPDVACSRAGLFRHPEDCSQFYECYWDKTINKFTLHIFECPVKLVFDNRIYGCNSAYWGPPCHKKN